MRRITQLAAAGWLALCVCGLVSLCVFATTPTQDAADMQAEGAASAAVADDADASEADADEIDETTQETNDMQAVDINDFNLEITSDGMAYSIISAIDSYTVAMTQQQDADGYESGYLYGFYRKSLDWSGQTGIAIGLINASESPLLIALQLTDAEWQSISVPDGTPVLLQPDGTTLQHVVFVADGMISVPAQFSGQVFVPLVSDDEILANLYGIGMTLIPQGTAACTFTQMEYWGEDIAAACTLLGDAQLTLADDALLIPQVGQSMTTASVLGEGEDFLVSYSLLSPPAGASIDSNGCILIDASVVSKSGGVTVQATINGRLVLSQTLTLFTVWDIKPEDMALEEFALLAPSQSVRVADIPVIGWCATHPNWLYWMMIGVGLALLATYQRWRNGSKDA